MRLSWDGVGVRLFKAGVDRGVLYPLDVNGYGDGVPWNGLTGVDDGSSGHEKTPLYTNDLKSEILFSPTEHGGTIKCFTYPDAFEACIGNGRILSGLYASAQDGTPFGLCYRVMIGNDIISINYAYELHLVYGAYVTEAKASTTTIGAESKPQEMNFSYESVVEEAFNHRATSHIILNTRFIDPDKVTEIEDILYGTDLEEPRLLLPDELYDILYEAEPVPDWYDHYPHDRRFPSNVVYPKVMVDETGEE